MAITIDHPDWSELQKLRYEFFEIMQEPQGFGFVSDDEGHRCSDAVELAQFVEDVAYQMQVAANKARGFAKKVWKVAETEN